MFVKKQSQPFRIELKFIVQVSLEAHYTLYILETHSSGGKSKTISCFRYYVI